MVVYEFYFKDGRKGDSLIGILPERRKDKKRVNRKSIMKWGKLAATSNVDPKSIYYVQIDLKNNHGSNFLTKEWVSYSSDKHNQRLMTGQEMVLPFFVHISPRNHRPSESPQTVDS